MTVSADNSTRSLIVRTGARLHFGFLSCKPAAGRQFGGVGVMVESPGFELVVREAEEFAYLGPQHWHDRVQAVLSRLRTAGTLPVPFHRGSHSSGPGGFEVEVRKEIPPHIGLGSGTQLAMAIASAVCRLQGEDEIGSETLAIRAGRGKRSAIGLHGFVQGGFLIDAGKGSDRQVGELADRLEFPEEWRFVLMTPPSDVGLAGRDEQEAFRSLSPMPSATTGHLGEIVASRLVPALREADIRKCGEALFEFGRIVGDYFAPAKGGTYANRRMADLVGQLRVRGVCGVGQTSWGPTIFALCGDQTEAEQVAGDIQADSRWGDCEFRVTAARNSPAEVRFLAD